MYQESVFKNKAAMVAIAMLAIVALGGGILLSEDSDAASTVKITLVLNDTDDPEVLTIPKGDMFYDHLSESTTYVPESLVGFLGWYLEKDYINSFSPYTVINKDLTIYARHFDPTTQYALTLYDTGLIGYPYLLKTVVVEHNAKAVKPSDPSRDGYKFTGWYYDTDPDPSVTALEKYDWSSNVTGEIVLYAGWEKSDFNIPMDVNILFWVFLALAILMFIGAIFTRSFGVGMLGVFMCILACIIYFGVIDMLMDAFKGLMPSS
jgi:uncharacterized repeat protein (TIGR02543 family)